jgi:hypothetical protein
MKTEAVMHGVDQAQALADAARGERLLDLRGDVHERHPFGGVKPELLAMALHGMDRAARKVAPPAPRCNGRHAGVLTAALA